MSEDSLPDRPAPAAQVQARPEQDGRAGQLTRQQKAAIILGVLGTEAAGPILEQFDEASLRGFAQGMARLRHVEPEVVEATIAEFLHELDRFERTVKGGLTEARGLLEPHLKDAMLAQILDDVDSPTAHNVWKKLGRVNEDALADFLKREHPQTAAVVLSKLSSEVAARLLSRFESDRARDIVVGIAKAQTLDTAVIEAIGASVSRDFLANHKTEGGRVNPAERVGAIMNFTAADIRNHVLETISEQEPDFAEEIKRRMFTFEDIPERVETRDVAGIVRAVEQETLLRALAAAEETAPNTREFLLNNISTRVADQLREDLAELGTVRRRDGEQAQNAVILTIRKLVERGEIKLIEHEDEV